MEDFEIILIEAVRGQIFWGDGSKGQGLEPPVRGVDLGSVRLR